jgi:hypothetical protein
MLDWFRVRGSGDPRRPRLRPALIIIGLTLALTAPAVVLAAKDRHFTAGRLDGGHEVPARVTNAHGIAKFKLSNDGTSLDYHLNVAQISNVFQAHIHMAPEGSNGDIVVWLYPSTAPGAGPLGTGPTSGLLANGTITAANLIGPLAGRPLSDLVTAMESGNAYVNVHTNDGVAPTNTGPGDFPGGEIRNQIRVQGSGS